MKKSAPPPQDPFHGVIIAAVTPRRESETSIDLGATLELVDFLGRSGANAIALLGSTGEFVHFALDDRRHMADFAVKRSRVPLLINVSHSTLDGAVLLAREAAASGAAGVLLMPPYYFRYSQEAVFTFYVEFAAQLRGELPVYLYNIPQFTNEIAIPTALALMDTGLFAGIKDSGGSWDYFTQLRDHGIGKPFRILAGNDTLFARARVEGAHGVVSGVASALPELLLALDRALAANDSGAAQILEARLREFTDWISKFPVPLAIKQALWQRGVNAGAPATVLGEGEAREMERFIAWFRPWFAALQMELNAAARTGRSR